MKDAKERKTRQMVIKMTEDEFEALERVAGHYNKSKYVRTAINNQIAVDRIRGVAGA